SGAGYLVQPQGERAVITLYQAGGQPFEAVQTFADGTFNKQFTIPNAPAGQHSVITVGTVSGLVAGRDSNNLTITPFINSLNPSFATSGSNVDIVGFDFGDDPGPGNRHVNLGLYTPVPDVNVVSWSDTKVTVQLPAPLLSG